MDEKLKEKGSVNTERERWTDRRDRRQDGGDGGVQRGDIFNMF